MARTTKTKRPKRKTLKKVKEDFNRLLKLKNPSKEQLKTMEREGIPIRGARVDARLKGLYPFGTPTYITIHRKKKPKKKKKRKED